MAGTADQRKIITLTQFDNMLKNAAIPAWKDLPDAPPATFERSGRPWHPACTNRLGCGYSERFEECIGCPYRQNGPTG